MLLKLHDKAGDNHVTNEENARGVAAAAMFFKWMGYDAAAEFRRAWQSKVTKAEQQVARQKWYVAETVALCAAFSGRDEMPENVTLILEVDAT